MSETTVQGENFNHLTVVIEPASVIVQGGGSGTGGSVTTDSKVTEGSANPVSGGAVYTALEGKAAAAHTHAQGDVSGLAADLTGKADASHTHAQEDVTGLAAALSGKAEGAALTQEAQKLAALQSKVDSSIHPRMEKVLLYYGYPIAVGGAWDVSAAVNIYKNYDICVFGDEYNQPTHEEYANTAAIFTKLKETAPAIRRVGYVPIGLHPDWEDSNLPMDELKTRVDLWVTLGVEGIFLDEFGYDYYVTRARQNEIVKYCHDKGLFVFANSWTLAYVFSTEAMTLDWMENFAPNPNSLPPEIGKDDYYLYENLFYSAKVQTDSSISLESSNVWRIDDVLGYYTRPVMDGKSYYEVYGTKLCSLDAIPSTMDLTQKNILQSISMIGASILNVTALAFGDENWGASGYYHHWDIPSLDLGTTGLNGVITGTREYTDENGEGSTFPYSWTANLNGHTYSLVFDVTDPNDETWVDGKRYVTVNGVTIENAWATIFDFQTDLRLTKESSAAAVTTAAAAVQQAADIKTQVDNVMPTLNTAEENIQAVVAQAQAQIEEATATLEAGLEDLKGVTAGFGYKEVQW